MASLCCCGHSGCNHSYTFLLDSLTTATYPNKKQEVTDDEV